ncbi:MAG TPA: tail assembly protein [Rhodanobacteraceae bacterium]|nr:tail assembly protein [Rhodanobacteraceae bacterium]
MHRVDLSTGSTAEAVRYLKANFRGVDDYLGSAKTRDGVGFAVFRGKENLEEKQLHEPSFGEEIRIAPIILGSKNGGVFNIIMGAAMIAAGVYFGQPGLVWAGIGQVAGGIVSLLTPRPKGLAAKDRPENTPSYAFNGPVNTQAQGHCVPVLYGRLWVGSAVISAGMDIKDDIVAPSWIATGGTGVGGGGMGRLHNGTNAVRMV